MLSGGQLAGHHHPVRLPAQQHPSGTRFQRRDELVAQGADGDLAEARLLPTDRLQQEVDRPLEPLDAEGRRAPDAAIGPPFLPFGYSQGSLSTSAVKAGSAILQSLTARSQLRGPAGPGAKQAPQRLPGRPVGGPELHLHLVHLPVAAVALHRQLTHMAERPCGDPMHPKPDLSLRIIGPELQDAPRDGQQALQVEGAAAVRRSSTARTGHESGFSPRGMPMLAPLPFLVAFGARDEHRRPLRDEAQMLAVDCHKLAVLQRTSKVCQKQRPVAQASEIGAAGVEQPLDLGRGYVPLQAAPIQNGRRGGVCPDRPAGRW